MCVSWIGSPATVNYKKNRFSLCNKSRHCTSIIYRVKTWKKDMLPVYCEIDRLCWLRECTLKEPFSWYQLYLYWFRGISIHTYKLHSWELVRFGHVFVNIWRFLFCFIGFRDIIVYICIYHTFKTLMILYAFRTYSVFSEV